MRIRPPSHAERWSSFKISGPPAASGAPRESVPEEMLATARADAALAFEDAAAFFQAALDLLNTKLATPVPMLT